jgi:hypothetical protein
LVRSSYRRGILAQLLGRGFLVRQQLGRIILGSSSSCGISWEFSRLENSDMKVLDFSLLESSGFQP